MCSASESRVLRNRRTSSKVQLQGRSSSERVTFTHSRSDELLTVDTGGAAAAQVWSCELWRVGVPGLHQPGNRWGQASLSELSYWASSSSLSPLDPFQVRTSCRGSVGHTESVYMEDPHADTLRVSGTKMGWLFDKKAKRKVTVKKTEAVRTGQEETQEGDRGKWRQLGNDTAELNQRHRKQNQNNTQRWTSSGANKPENKLRNTHEVKITQIFH